MDNIGRDLRQLADSVANKLNEIVSPTMYDQMTDEQRELIDQTRNSIDLSGDLEEKRKKLNKLLKNATTYNR